MVKRQHGLMDRVETATAVALYAYMLGVFGWAFLQHPSWIVALYAIDQSVVLAFQSVVLAFLVARRRANVMTSRLTDYLITYASTLLPLMAVPPSGTPLLPMAICVGLILAGTLIHMGAKLSLARSFGLLPANRGVTSSGLYRVVRHPMYLGYLLVDLSLLAAGPHLWNATIFGATWVLLLLRIRAEERLLDDSPDYRVYRSMTPYRLIPGIH